MHLVPGIGRHRIDRLKPEHPENPYRRMQSAGSRAGTAHPGTVCMLLGVPDRVIDQITGREPGGAARMRAVPARDRSHEP